MSELSTRTNPATIKKAAPVDYRRLYERHLGRVLEKGVHVHHIDHNRLNNSISNLVAIPASLHGQYHFKHRDYEITLIKGKPPRMPSKATIERYSFSRMHTEWYYRLSRREQGEFIDRCQDVMGAIRHQIRHLKAKEAYMGCLNKIKSIKKSQR